MRGSLANTRASGFQDGRPNHRVAGPTILVGEKSRDGQPTGWADTLGIICYEVGYFKHLLYNTYRFVVTFKGKALGMTPSALWT